MTEFIRSMAATDAKHCQAWAVTDAKNAKAWAAYELRVLAMHDIHSKSFADSQWFLDKVHSKCIADSQRLLDEHTARACQQEAARQEAASAAQHFIQERAALERQQGEAAHCQRFLDEETACLRCAAQARQTVAARVIFLWLRR